MIVILNLGGVIFQDFEIPDSIKAGGDQKLDVKKFIGGARTIDVLGSDDDDIEWSGRFRGSTAEARCQQLSFMKDAGQPITLTWSGFRYEVLIASFKFDYLSPLEITYRLRLTVVADLTAPIASPLPGIDQIFGTDLASALGLGDLLNNPEIISNLNQLETSVSTIQRLSGSSSPVLTALQGDIVSAQGATQTAISVASGQVTPVAGSVFGGTAGLPPQTIAANIAGQASAFGQLSNLYPLNDVLGRMNKNIATVGP
jgi:hypothetical protein